LNLWAAGPSYTQNIGFTPTTEEREQIQFLVRNIKHEIEPRGSCSYRFIFLKTQKLKLRLCRLKPEVSFEKPDPIHRHAVTAFN